MQLKRLLFAFCLVSAFTLTIQAQNSSTNIFERINFPIQGGNVTADIPNAVFSAGYYHFGSSKLSKTSGIGGINISGAERTGISGLLGSAHKAQAYKIYFTGGISFNSEYQAKNASPEEYALLLEQEKAKLIRDSIINASDTSYIFTRIYDIINKYGEIGDSLKLIYLKHGPSSNLQREWLYYAYRQKETAPKGFISEVEDLAVSEWTNRLVREGNIIEKERRKIQSQINIKDKPAQPYSQTNLFFDIGASGTAFNTVAFDRRISPNDSIPSFGRTNDATAYFAIGLNHFAPGKVNFGFRLGFMGNDNFETLIPMQYDSTRNLGRVTTTQTYYAYEGRYEKTVNPFFSASISFVSKVKNVGNVLVTPLFFTLSTSRNFGTSALFITKKNILLGCSLEATNYNSDTFYNGSSAFDRFFFGFRVGYLFTDFTFGE